MPETHALSDTLEDPLDLLGVVESDPKQGQLLQLLPLVEELSEYLCSLGVHRAVLEHQVRDPSGRYLDGLQNIIHNRGSNFNVLDVDAILLALLLDQVRELPQLLLVVEELHYLVRDYRFPHEGCQGPQILRLHN